MEIQYFVKRPIELSNGEIIPVNNLDLCYDPEDEDVINEIIECITNNPEGYSKSDLSNPPKSDITWALIETDDIGIGGFESSFYLVINGVCVFPGKREWDATIFEENAVLYGYSADTTLNGLYGDDIDNIPPEDLDQLGMSTKELIQSFIAKNKCPELSPYLPITNSLGNDSSCVPDGIDIFIYYYNGD